MPGMRVIMLVAAYRPFRPAISPFEDSQLKPRGPSPARRLQAVPRTGLCRRMSCGGHGTQQPDRGCNYRRESMRRLPDVHDGLSLRRSDLFGGGQESCKVRPLWR